MSFRIVPIKNRKLNVQVNHVCTSAAKHLLSTHHVNTVCNQCAECSLAVTECELCNRN